MEEEEMGEEREGGRGRVCLTTLAMMGWFSAWWYARSDSAACVCVR